MLEADCGGDLRNRDRGAPLLDAPQLYAEIFGMPGVCVRFGWERGERRERIRPGNVADEVMQRPDIVGYVAARRPSTPPATRAKLVTVRPAQPDSTREYQVEWKPSALASVELVSTG